MNRNQNFTFGSPLCDLHREGGGAREELSGVELGDERSGVG